MSCADRAPFTPFGHAMEFRINAEDPEHGFRPCPGTITRFEPPAGPGVRVEAYVHSGSTHHARSTTRMVAKLIVYGQDREECLARGRRALDEFVIEGIPTTLSRSIAACWITRCSAPAKRPRTSSKPRWEMCYERFDR